MPSAVGAASAIGLVPSAWPRPPNGITNGSEFVVESPTMPASAARIA